MASTPPGNEIPPVPVPPPGMVVGAGQADDASDAAPTAPPLSPPGASPPAATPPAAAQLAPTPVEPLPAAPAAASASSSQGPPQPLPRVTPASSSPQSVPARPDPYAAPGQQPSFAAQQPIQPSQQQQPYAYAPVAAGPNQTLSIIAMVAGIIGVLGSFVGLGLLPALAGVIMGHIAQKRQPWAKAFWITALITGYVGVAISLVSGLIVLIALLAAIAGNS